MRLLSPDRESRGEVNVAAPADFSERLASLDVGLFHAIFTQSSDRDRRSWLAVQRSVRRPAGYVYLEVGSHLGGSIQQHLLDPWCRQIISIDKRPLSQHDDRDGGRTFQDQGTPPIA